MDHRQQAHDNQEKQAQGCIIVDVIIPTNLVYVLFDPSIPILYPSISLFFILVILYVTN